MTLFDQVNDRAEVDSKVKPLVVAGIPAFNEERTIAKLVLEAQKYVDVVLVCDDGSTDCTAEIAERMGNAHPVYAPHNVYRCWGADHWLALGIHSDEEFNLLTELLGKPDLATDPRFSDMKSRKKNEAELNSIIEEWTSARDRDWMVRQFCEAGLIAAPSRDARDLYADAHLKARGAFVKVDHPELGELEMVGSPWQMSDYEMPVQHAPLLGEHTDEILRGLKYTHEDIEKLHREGIVA